MEPVALKHTILAIVTTDRDLVAGGSVPVFYAKDDAELQKICLYLSRVLDALTHGLDNGISLIVKH